MSRRLAGPDLARAFAMLGMLVEHTLQYPTIQPKGILWSVYGRSGPLFVLLAGTGLSLAAGIPGRRVDRVLLAARIPLLLVAGMALSTRGDGVILQSFALFFVVGIAAIRFPRWALAAAAGACLVVGPLFLTVLRRRGELQYFGSRSDVGFHALLSPLTLLHGLALEYYPAVIWMGFFFVGMLLGRCDLASAASGRRLLAWSAPAAALLFTAGWAGARAFGPPPDSFALAPNPPTTWSQHWTTYGFSDSVGWALSSTATALAVVGGCVWATAVARRRDRLPAPLVALGAMSLTFYVLHFVYLGTAWPRLQPYLSNTPSYFFASVAFWVLFAMIAGQWLTRVRRGPFESVLHVGALALVSPLRRRWYRPSGRRSIPGDVAEEASARSRQRAAV